MKVYLVTWYEDCFWIDHEKRIFDSFAKAKQYIAQSIINTKKIDDDEIKQYILEDLQSNHWDDDFYSIEEIVVNEI